MKNKFNLFNHLPREMSTDSSLMWLFHFINEDEQLQLTRNSFLESLVFRPEDFGKSVSDVKARRKEKSWERDSDIVLDFKLDGEPKTVLFDTRIASFTTLKGYRSVYPNLYTCIYLKEDLTNHRERRLAEKHGYLVRDIELLLVALLPLAENSSIIQQYCEYLEDHHEGALEQVRSAKTKPNSNSNDFYRLRSRYLRFA